MICPNRRYGVALGGPVDGNLGVEEPSSGQMLFEGTMTAGMRPFGAGKGRRCRVDRWEVNIARARGHDAVGLGASADAFRRRPAGWCTS